MNQKNQSTLAVALLKERVRIFLRFDINIERKIKIECQNQRKLYNGTISWPEKLQAWRREQHRELIAFSRKHGLCRKNIKEAAEDLRKEISSEVEK